MSPVSHVQVDLTNWCCKIMDPVIGLVRLRVDRLSNWQVPNNFCFSVALHEKQPVAPGQERKRSTSVQKCHR